MRVGKHCWFLNKVRRWTMKTRGDLKRLWKQSLEGGNFILGYSTYWRFIEWIYCLFVYITEIKIRHTKKVSEAQLWKKLNRLINLIYEKDFWKISYTLRLIWSNLIKIIHELLIKLFSEPDGSLTFLVYKNTN